MSQKRTILKRITIILLAIICPAFALAQGPCSNASNFQYTKITMRSVSLAWTNNSNSEASYLVKNGDEVVATVADGETTCEVNDLDPNTSYTFTLYTQCGDNVLDDPLSITFTTVKGPRVEGYVCGGARMADVNGSSRVTVVNCDHLYAVYGGNDIAGEVKAESSHYGDGSDAYTGAEVIIGTENSEQVLIDYVYGGGSGLYNYPIGTITTQFTNKSQTKVQEITYVNGTPLDARTDPGNPLAPDDGAQYNRLINQDTMLRELSSGNVLGYFGSATGYNSNYEWYNGNNLYAKISADGDDNYPTIPRVDRTRIFVNSDNVYIDSLFGGAESAQVGKDEVSTNAPADTSVSVTINKGTVFALFGGNNYGGLLGKGTYQHIVVNDTKKAPASSLYLGGDIATGKSHVRTKHTVRNAANTDDSNYYTYAPVVDAHGIRYLFGGGNDVMARNVHVEINGGQIDTLFGGGNSADVASTTIDVNVIHPLYSSYSDSYDPSTSVYDIRCLFGGNNAAHMYSVPTLNINSGGIHNLYGGGNNGLMLGSESYADNDALYAHTGEGSPVSNAIRSTKIEINGSVVVDTIYGGGQSAGTLNDTYIHLSAGSYGTVFGGTNILGNIGYQGTDGLGRYQDPQAKWREYAKTNLLVDDADATIINAVFGGSNGFYMCPDGTQYTKYGSSPVIYGQNHTDLVGKDIPLVWQTNIWVSNSYYDSEFDVYGGGNLAPVGALSDGNVTLSSEGNTFVRVTGDYVDDINGHFTTIKSLYGGGNYASIYGNATINIYGGIDGEKGYPWIDNVYGGNDKAGTVTGGPSRTGHSTEASTASISWDSLPSYMASVGEYSIADNKVSLNLNKDNAASYILVEGSPYIESLYGGGNGHYDYFSWDDDGNESFIGSDNDDVSDVFFNSSSMIEPNQTSSFVDLNIQDKNNADEIVTYVYGGGNNASVGENVPKPTNNEQTFTGYYPTVWLNAVDYKAIPEVDYLFGGNNHVDMSAVPRIYLLKGVVGEVYGGGNEGGMNGSQDLQFANSYSVPGVSTCVMVVSDESDVKKNIFGGCNVESVTNDTYVGIRRGTVTANVFGGNNIAGDVPVSHIDIFGSDTHPITVHGEVFGGGKGDYEYTNDGNNKFNVNVNTEEGYIYYGVASRPYTEVTNIKVANSASSLSADAVTMNGNIYGGGLAGGCRETTVDINAPDGVFDCMIFGGGKGIISQIGNANSSFDGYAQVHGAEGTTRHHAGNIHTHDDSELASTNVHIRQMKSMNIDGSSRRKAVFGGGYSGDVDGNTYVTLYETNTARIPAVYLGGVAADVTGTATGLFNGSTPADSRANIVDTIYGGNDFTGRVYVTDLTINSGAYQHVFGAGNGDYVYKDVFSMTTAPDEEQPQHEDYCTTPAADGRYWRLFGSGVNPKIDTVPYSMKVNVTFNGGTFRGNVYGGGNLGLVGNRDMNPDDMDAADADRYANLGHIHVIINDGDFKSHVYGGARGKSRLKDRFFGTAISDLDNVDGSNLGRQLVYGLKQVDMYGGSVYFSLHGGSESVDDGYPFECIGPLDANTNFYKPLADRVKYGSGTGLTLPNSTLRPSSIVNIIGGHVRKSLYGGGYQGNIYGSVYVNIGAQAVKDSPVWTKYADMRIDDEVANTIGSFKPDDALLVPNPLKPIKLDASVYNCADWGEAGDKAYFNTRGVFGGETDIIIDGEGYNTSGNPFYSGSDPEMTIAVSVIGAGTSTEGGDINRLVVMRNYGSYLCPKPLKSLYSIQRADKVVLDNVYINLYGEQDAFESYASPNFSLNRLDTLALCNDNVLNIESPANFIGIHASLKNIADVYHLTTDIAATSPNLVTNSAEGGIAQTSDNLASNDILDNQVAGDCTDGGDGCESLDVCALVPTNRGDRGRPGKFNTIIIDQGSYMKISPFVDIADMRNVVDANNDGDYDDDGDVAPLSGRDGVDDNDDAVSSNDHAYGHVFGYTYLVAPLETMGYVYGIYKNEGMNSTDGGFVSPCTCNNQGTYQDEIDYLNVTSSGPYRTWKIGTANGLRKRSATLIANKEPDRILNWPLPAGDYPTSIGGSSDRSLEGSNFAYATAAIELPPAQKGNFYIVESIEIDQANGGEMHLIDEGYEAISGTIFQAWNHSSGSSSIRNLEAIEDHGNEETHNLTFGLTMSGVAPSGAGRSTNFASGCWTGSNIEDAGEWNHPLYEVTTESGPTNRDIRVYTTDLNGVRVPTDDYYDCWPITSISGGTYFNTIGGYISNAVESADRIATDGILPRIALTLTYDTRINNTISRDVTFRMLEYDKYGHYVGPIDVTVTINTVIRNFSDIEAPVLAMYNEGLHDEYVRRVNIPASFMQRELYLEDIKWERTSAVKEDHFYLQGMDATIDDEKHFAIQVSPVEMVSNTLNNHLGWYDIVEENRYLDIYKTALDDLTRRTGATAMTDEQSIDYTSWHSDPKAIHNVVVRPNNSAYGSVTIASDDNSDGTASFAHGAMATITATPNAGYEFVNWSDGNSSATRTIPVNEGVTYYANFVPTGSTPTDAGTITLSSNNSSYGTVNVGSGPWYVGSYVTFYAVAENGYKFQKWGDENTDNPRTIEIANSNPITMTATFIEGSTDGYGPNEIVEHYDGVMPSYAHDAYTGNTWGDEYYDDRISTTSLHGREGIKLGTLDGRAPATLDVTLKYNGEKTYYDHFAENDPGPLAWAYLKMHWYNTNTEDASGPDDGIFWVKVKLRTREKGDTIYMAPPNPNVANTLTRPTIEGVSSTVRYWNHSDFNRDGNILNYADDIRNNPDSYVHTFPEALSIYQEGDVIDIMETIEIGVDDSPLSVGNSDFEGIQIIRYSGSHFKFPSLGCANPNALVEVNNGARISFRNIRFNGSGATRVKKKETTAHPNSDSVTTIVDGQYYNASGDRIKAIYFAQSPILQCNSGGQLSLNEKVSLTNNFNKASNGINGISGGAVAVLGGTVVLGDNTVIRDNMVVEHTSVDNYGGGVYVDGGVLRVGPNVEDAECMIDIQHNYYYKGSDANVLDAVAPAGFAVVDDHNYRIDTTASSNFSLSNVYLKRTESGIIPTGSNASEVAAILKVRDDDRSDRILFTGALTKGSRIGVSKWFPGYRYTSTGSSQALDNDVPRDTVSIAVLSGSTKAVMAQQNFNNQVFFNDSNYFAQTSGTRSFNTDNDFTEYHIATTAFPAYNDQVKTFYHNYVDDKTIYFQRCASFGKGVSRQLVNYTTSAGNESLSDFTRGDSIAFLMNPDATCVAITDTIVFKVGGGFFPYTYHWDYDSVLSPTADFATPELYRKGVRDRQTYDPNSISDLSVSSYAAKRHAAERDTLVLYALEERPTLLQSTYFFQATATDVAGCAVTQPVMVRVAKNHDSENIVDNGNFLLYGNSYVVTSSVDSSYFHGHASPTTGFTGSSAISASFMVPGVSDWVADPNAASYASYGGNNVPRYMRTYHSFKVKPAVMPQLAGEVIDVYAYTAPGGTRLNLAVDQFCPGSMVYLMPREATGKDSSNWEYMSWDFDPSSGRNTTFVVGNTAESNNPTVYYAPGLYWWQVVNTYLNEDSYNSSENIATRYDYETDYYGNVTIKTEKGLAWLISRVNGYNGQSARTFHFNTITLDLDPSLDGKLDMGAHKWTPLGNQTNPFEGTFVGNGNKISNLIVNEEVLPLVGMFGYTDSADISNFTLQEVQMKGNSYIGSLVAHANNSDIKQINVDNGILFSEYVVGGLIAKADNTTYIDEVVVSQAVSPVADDSGDDSGNGTVAVQREPLKVKGNAIYFGGICGQNTNSDIANSTVNEINQDYLSALYSGPLLGNSEGVPSNNGKAVLRNSVMNCYSHIKSTGNAERLGGLVGRAEAIDMANCYVYGEAKATDFTGALAGYVGTNVDISNCYYVDGLSNEVVGFGTSSSVHKSSAFHGQGKQVLLNDRIDGYNNLLRALNGWVDRQEGDRFLHWRPAVGNENGGYPLFGDPEMIEVFDTFNIATCDSYDFDGITLTQSGTYTMHFVDSTDYLDSTVTLMLTINYGDTVEVVDTVLLGQGYEGYGISLTAEQVSAAFGNDHSVDIRAMMYIDSLLNANGCDSLVMLTLFIVNENVDINSQPSTLNSQLSIYPNPTRGMVYVEGSDIISVEVYDNISRRVTTIDNSTTQQLNNQATQKLSFDLTNRPAGAYYVRVRTAHGAVVKKVIKK